MAQAFDINDAESLLKDYYTDDPIAEQSFYKNPMFAILSGEAEECEGRRVPQPIEITHPGGASANYGEAMTGSRKSTFEDFMLAVKEQYSRVLVDYPTILKMRSKKGAFKKAIDEFDRGFRGVGEKIAKRLYRTAGGTVGKSTNISTAAVTLEDPADAFNFDRGDRMQLVSAMTGGTLRGSGGVLTVVGVARQTGIITFDAAPNTLSGATIGDFFVRKGDYDACLSGLEDWLPVTNRAARLAATFNGVVRTLDEDRLGGIYIDGSGLGGLDEILIQLVGMVGMHGGSPDVVFVNPRTMVDLQILLQGKTVICTEVNTKMRGEDGNFLTIGFPGLRVQVGGATVTIYGDRNCPSNRIYALQKSTWKLWHLGSKLVDFLGADLGLPRLKMAETEPSVESKNGSYIELGCSAPGWNGVASIPVATA